MNDEPILRVVFFRTESGREPVREWLCNLSRDDRKTIGEDIKLVQFRQPLGMPLVRKVEPGLWEVRSRLKGGRIDRLLDPDNTAVTLDSLERLACAVGKQLVVGLA